MPKASFENPLDVAVERYTEWDVEKGGWKGELPDIQGLAFVDDLSAYIDRIFARFQNPYLQDETARVGREPIRKLAPTDRLIKPLVTAASYGLPVDHLLFGAAAALRFRCPEDAQSEELRQKVESEGAAAALAAYTGLKPEDALFGRILDVYRALSLAGK